MSIEHISQEEIVDQEIIEKIGKEITEQYHMIGRSLSKNVGEGKITRFGGVEYTDTFDTVYIPIDSNFRVVKEYSGRFVDDNSKYLIKIAPVSMLRDTPVLTIHTKGSYPGYSKSSLTQIELRSSGPVVLNEKIDHDEALKNAELVKLLKSTNDHFNSYHDFTNEVKRKKTLEDIAIREYEAQAEEGDLDALLEELQDMN